jgi:DNA-binding YbaB/EbfC family protein
MADMFKLMQQAQQMQARMQEMQESLQNRTVTGTAGGGMVSVDVDGAGAVRRVKIDPTVVNAADVEMLEDLVLVAVTEAQRKAKEFASEEMGKLTGGLNLPFKLPF